MSIAKALIYNPTLSHLKVNFNHKHRLYDKFKTTFHRLQALLNIPIGEDGARVQLGRAFKIKSRSIRSINLIFRYESNDMNPTL
jgi:hypothetical protein